ncbi:BBE domain-containing protein [Vineibacter terrae]|uniref:BBE domain-containing protein n=1 Tax=Vineibacter terrae TaxID=2586908 RepID=UPI002E315450|nr:BBE domain-containing protein [Vineibacter terrae]HEX2891420.1 BBE domain-containing protein [Vineibacter terrae]
MESESRLSSRAPRPAAPSPAATRPMSPDDWRRHFGATWPRLRDAKQRFDPANVFTPGYEVFAAGEGPLDRRSRSAAVRPISAGRHRRSASAW